MDAGPFSSASCEFNPVASLDPASSCFRNGRGRCVSGDATTRPRSPRGVASDNCGYRSSGCADRQVGAKARKATRSNPGSEAVPRRVIRPSCRLSDASTSGSDASSTCSKSRLSAGRPSPHDRRDLRRRSSCSAAAIRQSWATPSKSQWWCSWLRSQDGSCECCRGTIRLEREQVDENRDCLLSGARRHWARLSFP